MADRIRNDLPPKIRLDHEDLIPGRSFTTQRRGHEAEEIVFENLGMGIDRRGRERLEAQLFNPSDKRNLRASYTRFLNGQIGMSRVIAMQPVEEVQDTREVTNEDQSYAEGVRRVIGTDTIFIIPKGGDPVPTVIAKNEGGTLILGEYRNPQKQIFRTDLDTIKSGGDEEFRLVTVPDKFKMIVTEEDVDQSKAAPVPDKPLKDPEKVRRELEWSARVLESQEHIKKPTGDAVQLVTTVTLPDIHDEPVHALDLVEIVARDPEVRTTIRVKGIYLGMVIETRSAVFGLIPDRVNAAEEPEIAPLEVPLEALKRSNRLVTLEPLRESV